MEIVTSWMEKGVERGFQQGERTLLLRLLRKQLGDLSPEAAKLIDSLPLDRLEQLGEALLDFSSPDDLHAWLQSHP